MTQNPLKFYDYNPKLNNMFDEVVEGLTSDNKYLPPKYFYDEKGSELFADITRLPEYYPTRSEVEILKNHGNEIADVIGVGQILIEYGSGNSEKIRHLLNALKPRVYMPLDISKDHLIKSANMLLEDFPWLEVHAACLDYSRPNRLPMDEYRGKRLAFFPGSSIGNFLPDDAAQFLKHVRYSLSSGDGLLLGVDMHKDKSILEAAYNDTQGITAQFNLNVLTHINYQLGAQFDIDRFQHHAFYNESLQRIEMHLVSQLDQVIPIKDTRIKLRKDENIHTENSYKFTKAGIESLASLARFRMEHVWQDQNQYFSLIYFKAV